MCAREIEQHKGVSVCMCVRICVYMCVWVGESEKEREREKPQSRSCECVCECVCACMCLRERERFVCDEKEINVYVCIKCDKKHVHARTTIPVGARRRRIMYPRAIQTRAHGSQHD